MNSQGFSFPPPPPPPPQQQPQPTYPLASQHGQSYGQRGGRGGQQRGRGRGFGNRGGSRGVQFGTTDAARSHPYSANPSLNYAQMNYSGYAAQGLPTHTPGSMPTSHYAQSQHSSFRHAPNQSAFPPQSFSQPSSHMPPPQFQHQPRYDSYNQSPNMQHQMNPYPPHTTSSYTITPPQRTHPSARPPMMGPPMHWGFERAGNAGPYPAAQYGTAGGAWAYNTYGSQAQGGGKGPKHPMKRDHNSAFGKPRSAGPRTPAPPAVPSFGNPLPSKPPPPADASRKPRKKKRKHNQLGLTPKTEEHESSEEEDDADEESKLAEGSSGAAAAMKFTYKGRTSTLQSAADIAAWIEERKSRFPTQARIEERKKAMEEAKKAREAASRQKELQKQEYRRLQKEAREQKERQKHDHKELQENPSDPVNAAAKAKQKADRLRRRLMKEEKRVAKAEADAERARLKAESLQKDSTDNARDGAAPGQDVLTMQNAGPDEPEAFAGHSTASGQGMKVEPNIAPGDSETTDRAAIPPSEEQATRAEALEIEVNGISSPDLSEDSDWTSSSGSELSSSNSEESDSDSDDDAPEEMTSRREDPERVAPPPREDKKTRVCRHFARTGRCIRGEKCKFLHEVPERKRKQPIEKKGRKGLLQALLDRQKEDEDRRVMEAIMILGEKGALEPYDEPKD